MGVARLAIATLLLLLPPPTRSLRSPSSLSSVHLEFSRDDFPQSFVFGAGTSAYQAEGAVDEDGRSPSVWDTFTHAGLMEDGSTADVSADAYHKYKEEDVKLMNETGLEAYRFSISWSRLIPNGRGAVNPKGLEYYNNLINELVKHGIQPHVTLFHLDLPQVLEDEYAGWLSPRIVNDFVAYAEVCFREFGDRVSHWTTINEPNMFAVGAYDNGLWPPRRCSPPFGFFNCGKGNSSVEPYVVVHHVLLAHAAVVELYRAKYQAVQRGCVGMNVYSFAFSPLTDSAADAEATKRAKDFMMGWIIEPLISDNPDYPKGLSDFNGDIRIKYARRKNDTPSAWRFLEYLKQEYGNPPVYIHESGFGTPRSVTINDTERIDVLKGYIGAILAAIRNGSNARGYFVWSFMDVFELLKGYQTTLGLYHVDFVDEDRKRQAKLSALWYRDFLSRGKQHMAS